MFKIQSESELREFFRPLDRDDLQFPRDLSFPVRVRDYLAWVEPSGAKAFLVFRDSPTAKPLGVVFRRGSGSAVAMCEWCHSVGGGEGVGLLTASASANRRVGIHICCDLSCAEKIRSNPGVNDFPRGQSERQRIRALLERMGQFTRQNLF